MCSPRTRLSEVRANLGKSSNKRVYTRAVLHRVLHQVPHADSSANPGVAEAFASYTNRAPALCGPVEWCYVFLVMPSHCNVSLATGITDLPPFRLVISNRDGHALWRVNENKIFPDVVKPSKMTVWRAFALLARTARCHFHN